MRIADLQVGDELEDYRRGRHLRVTEIAPNSGGNGEIAYEVVGRRSGFASFVLRRERKTFGEFERLKFVRRWKDRHK